MSKINAADRSDNRLVTASVVFECPHVLHVLAYFNAASAVNAFVAIQDNFFVRSIRFLILENRVKAHRAEPEFRRELLEFAVMVARAFETIVRMIRKNQLKNSAARLAEFRIVG